MAVAPPSGLAYPFGDTVPEPGAAVVVAPGVRWLRFAVPGPLRHVNAWLLDDDRGVAVVDTGFDSPPTREAWDAVIDGALAGRSVTRVMCTHMHPDHSGLAGWLTERFRCPLLMTRTEWLTLRLLIADARDTVPAEVVAFWRAAGWDGEAIERAAARGWAMFRRLVAPVPLDYRRIVDGERLTIGATEWRVVVGAGHSPEHACLLDERGGVLIAGDQVLPRITPNVSLTASEPMADPLGDWLASIDRLRALPAGLLVLPGHGEPFTGLHARLDAMAREHEERLDALATLLAERPVRAVDTFASLFRRPVDDDMRGMATGEALAHLRRLEVEGRAPREERDGVWWWSAA